MRMGKWELGIVREQCVKEREAQIKKRDVTLKSTMV